MYKIAPPSQQTQKGPKLRQSPVSQLQNNETVTEEVLQSSTEQYREQLEEMLDLKPSIRDFKSNNKNNKPDLWNTIQQIEKRMQEQEQNLQRVNSEQSEEINKLKSEIKQQKQQYEQEIEEIKYSSRIQSQKPQPSYNSYTPKNTRDYSYRSVSNNNLEDMQEKNYLQQLVQDLKQQISVLQQKNYYSPIQNTDNIWEQKFRQLEKQKETELQMKDQHHIERIRNLETQLLNQKQSYENELFAIRKILDEKSKEDSLLRHQNQQLQKDLNSYINQVQYFNKLVQFTIIIDIIIKSVNLVILNINTVIVQLIAIIIITAYQLLELKPVINGVCQLIAIVNSSIRQKEPGMRILQIEICIELVASIIESVNSILSLSPNSNKIKYFITKF